MSVRSKMTNVDFTLHLQVLDQEPGTPQTLESLKEWLIPDILRAVERVIGHPGDYDALWAGDPRFRNYTVTIEED
jgi:hypothetical protein